MKNKTSTPCEHEEEDVDLVCVYDNPHNGYAFNVYLCECGCVIKENVWKSKGRVIIDLDGTLTSIEEGVTL